MAARVPVAHWVAGARPRTLVAAVVPVAVGAGAAVGHDAGPTWWRLGPALVVAVAMQVGVNYANDYSDGVRGTDDASRVGPLRLVGSGRANPGAVKTAALAAFVVGAGAGLILVAAVGWPLLIVGAASLAAGWTYTGGPRPYGYLGFGEVFVFVFFGLVATVGTTYVVVEDITFVAVGAAVSVGLWATALLVVNNLRDIPGDASVGKRTLAVRMGDGATRWLFVVLLALAYVAAGVVASERQGALAALAGAPVAVLAARRVVRGDRGADLVPVLGLTGAVEAISGTAMALGLALSS